MPEPQTHESISRRDGKVWLKVVASLSKPPDTADFALVAFSGADHAEACIRWARKRSKRYSSKMETPYPGIGREIREDKFMNWPNEKWSKGSYYFPRVNEVTKWGPFWKAGHRGWLHFAGEHTCYSFMGYMEGALSSGYRIARRIAVRDELFPA
jgi:monoamine oxidase